MLPLLRPAILAALVYSFVRAMTAISAVIFLVSARYDMSTSYIVGRVENNEYGIAIAYSAVLIVVMLAVIGLMQLAVGSRNIGRRGSGDGDLSQSRTNVSLPRAGSRHSQEAADGRDQAATPRRSSSATSPRFYGKSRSPPSTTSR